MSSYFAKRRNMLLSAGVMQGTRLDDLSVGDSVYIFEGSEDDGNLYPYILIAANNYPTDGVVLLMRDGAITNMQYAANNITGYSASPIDSVYLAGEGPSGYLGQFSPEMRAKIQSAEIDSHTSYGASIKLQRRAFILSDTEIRDSAGALYSEGEKIAYFDDNPYPSGAWTRQPYSYSGAYVYQLYATGVYNVVSYNSVLAVIPCICLLGSERVDANNTLIV